MVGERITVSGINANYNGSYVISAVTATTVTYLSSVPVESSVASSGTIVNDTIATGYNGTKIIEALTSTTIQYLSYSDATASTGGTYGGTPTITDLTNTELNGTRPIAAVPSGVQLQYNKA